MITINNKEIRNLQEQVLKNMRDIQDILGAEKVLADFGIKVLGHLADTDELYDKYPEETYTGDFGDCFTIGDQVPFEYYVFTRTEDTSKKGIWFLIGTFPQPGPQGPQGIQGIQGERGPAGTALLSGTGAPVGTGELNQLYLNLITSTIYKYNGASWVPVGNIRGQAGEQGIPGQKGDKGDTGATGPQGPQGDVGGFINIQGHVGSIADLPVNPMPTDHTWAYLVGDDYKLYVQIPTIPGGSVYNWQDFGTLNVGTYITVNGEFVNVYEMNNKLDKVTSTAAINTTIRFYAIDYLGNQVIITGYYNDGNTSTNVTNYIPIYRNGQIVVAIPTNPYNAANKKYVDDNLPSIWRG